MRKLICWVALATAACVPLGRAAAQESGPTIEVRVRSVNDLVGKFDYLGGVLNQAEQAKQLVGVVQAFTDEKKGIEGIDPARPIGLYGSVTKDVVDSPIVVLIPIADETAFLNLLTGKLNLDPKKENGVYTVQVPNVPVPVLFRFADEYVHITVQSDAAIAPKKLIAPKEFFSKKDDAILTALVHFDRLPDDLKKTVFGQFELKVNDAKARKDAGESPAQKKLRVWALDQLTSVVKTVFADGKDLGIRLTVTPKSDDIAAEVIFTGKEGSTLAKWITSIGAQSSVAAAVAGSVKNPLASLGLKFDLPPNSKKELEPVVEALIEEAIEGAKDKDVARKVLEAVTPTLKAGKFEAGLTVTGPNEDGKLKLVAAVKTTDGNAIAKLLEELAPHIPADKAQIELNAKKAGDVAIHKIEISNEDIEKKFGTKNIWLGTSDALILLSIEADGSLLQTAAKSKPAKVEPAEGELSLARMFGIDDKALKPDQVKKLVVEAFGGDGAEGKDTVTVKLTGGDSLAVRANVKGKGFKMAILVDQAKKKN
ncbi:hypothetical protein [Fimbriiglobus ruber]|uniref:Uncharacterized protein n=1 Tax=Fimbriiglobus ruber TaxID=1908690 RepID=A0A225D1F9_9BACT|nr:hypothetical protein [Fimbriiglobus ruber]OWK34763.1 hypothetical protein FRUB_09605 [Fimbriiglobus ruber]